MAEDPQCKAMTKPRHRWEKPARCWRKGSIGGYCGTHAKMLRKPTTDKESLSP